MRNLGRIALAVIFVTGGMLHLVKPGLYRPYMPAALPAHDALILISGLAEIAGGLGLLIPRTRRAAGIGLILLLIAVFPANVQMLQVYRARGGPRWGELLLWGRLPLQAALVWCVFILSRRADPPRSDAAAPTRPPAQAPPPSRR